MESVRQANPNAKRAVSKNLFIDLICVRAWITRYDLIQSNIDFEGRMFRDAARFPNILAGAAGPEELTIYGQILANYGVAEADRIVV